MSAARAGVPGRDRALVALAAPSWRARYEPEFVALLEDTRATPGRTLDVLRLVARSWAAPPRHLFDDREARVRTSVATLLWAWTVLVGAELIVAQLREDPSRAATDRRYAGAAPLYRLYEIAAVAGVLIFVLGCAPLAWHVVRSTRRAKRADLTLLMSSPVFALAGFAVVLLAVVSFAPRSAVPGVGVGSWALAIIAAGVAAGVSCAAGPTHVLRALPVGGPTLRAGLVTSTAGALLCAVAGVAALGYLVVLTVGAAPVGIAAVGFVVPFGLAVLAATAVVLVSGARGARGLLARTG
jgi:hypothetical protein